MGEPIRVEIEGHDPMEFPEGTDPKVIDMVVKRDILKVTPSPTKDTGLLTKLAKAVDPYTKYALPVLGAVSGGAAALPANLIAPGIAEATGIGLGTLGGQQLANMIGQKAGRRGGFNPLELLTREVPEAGINAASGPLLNKVIPAIAKVTGRVGKEIFGVTTGAGPGATEEAIKGGTAFKSALRGNITGDEVVDTTRSALQQLKDKRASDYVSKLSKIKAGDPALGEVGMVGNTGQEIDTKPISDHLKKLLTDYNVKMIPNPKTGRVDLDYSRVAIGESGRKDIEGIIRTITDWGSKEGDKTVVGLDTLKRQLSDFYSDSSQARQFVASLTKKVGDTIKTAVPEYGEMTKGYSEATNLIKDIESGLMLRKNGMSGRVTADQTLKRLTSAMREGSELRRDLIDILGNQSGQDLSGMVAGYAMNQAIPRGLVGKIGAGSALMYLNPKMWPLVAASSPRVAGEFLMVLGKAKPSSETVSKSLLPTLYATTANSEEIKNKLPSKEYLIKKIKGY